MKTFFKILLAVTFTALTLAGCDVKSPDFFVPEVAFAETDDQMVFDNAGGNKPLFIEANCDWTIFCPADWVTLSTTEGLQDAQLTITVTESKLDRSTTITITSNEVDVRRAEITVFQTGVIEISTVEQPTVLDLTTAEGTTASLNSLYTGISISDTDVITAGFVLTPVSGGSAIEFDAMVDMTTQIFTCQAAGLEPGIEYSCLAWAKLNDDQRVESNAIVFATVSIPPSVSSVAQTIVVGAKSDDGTTATLQSSFETVSVTDQHIITAGFTLSPEVNASPDVVAAIGENQKFSANITGLIPEVEYTVTAWAKLENGERVESTITTFIPEIGIPVSITVDFTSNEVWQLPGRQEDMVKEVLERTVNGRTYQLYGAAINSGSLWIASVGKKGYNGYIQLPKLDGLTVKSIRFPNDGSGLSGSARVTLWMSTDGGENFTAVPGCVGVDMRVSQAHGPFFELSDQPEGVVYKIENVDVNGTNGFSKTTKMIINAID